MTAALDPIIARRISFLLAAQQTSAFLKAHPEKYNFMEVRVPDSEECTACFMGWMGYFSGTKARYLSETALSWGFDRTEYFYNLLWIHDPVWTINPTQALSLFHRLVEEGLL